MEESSVREDLAWAAGFFDGEGSTCGQLYPSAIKQGRSTFSPVLQVPQIDRQRLERFQVAVGGLGTIAIHNRTPDGDPYMSVWRTSRFEHVQAVLAMLWPFLSVPKRQQAADVLCRRNSLDPVFISSSGHGHTPREEVAWAAGFFDAEGCTALIKVGSPKLSVSQNDVATLERFQAAINGIGTIRHRISGCSLWDSARHEYSQATLAMLWAFLSDGKRQQGLRAFREWMSRPQVHNRTAQMCTNGLHPSPRGPRGSGECEACQEARRVRTARRNAPKRAQRDHAARVDPAKGEVVRAYYRERYGSDREAKREYDRAYYAKNRERVRTRKNARAREHRERQRTVRTTDTIPLRSDPPMI